MKHFVNCNVLSSNVGLSSEKGRDEMEKGTGWSRDQRKVAAPCSNRNEAPTSSQRSLCLSILLTQMPGLSNPTHPMCIISPGLLEPLAANYLSPAPLQQTPSDKTLCSVISPLKKLLRETK